MSNKLTTARTIVPTPALLVISLINDQTAPAADKRETTMQKTPHLPLSENMNPPIILRTSKIDEKTNATMIAPTATDAISCASSGVEPLSIAACFATAATAVVPTAVTMMVVTKRMVERMVAIKIISAHTESLFFIEEPSF